jgi:hypothetical protein
VVKDEYMKWLQDEFPDLVPRYEAMYARSAYAPAADRKALGATVSGLIREEGGLRLKPGIAPRFSHRNADRDRPAPVKGDQLRLL